MLVLVGTPLDGFARTERRRVPKGTKPGDKVRNDVGAASQKHQRAGVAISKNEQTTQNREQDTRRNSRRMSTCCRLSRAKCFHSMQCQVSRGVALKVENCVQTLQAREAEAAVREQRRVRREEFEQGPGKLSRPLPYTSLQVTACAALAAVAGSLLSSVVACNGVELVVLQHSALVQKA